MLDILFSIRHSAPVSVYAPCFTIVFAKINKAGVSIGQVFIVCVLNMFCQPIPPRKMALASCQWTKQGWLHGTATGLDRIAIPCEPAFNIQIGSIGSRSLASQLLVFKLARSDRWGVRAGSPPAEAKAPESHSTGFTLVSHAKRSCCCQ